jgi:hypothetical protein
MAGLFLLLGGLALTGVVLLARTLPRGPVGLVVRPDAAADIRSRIAAGRQALDEGNLQVAVEALGAAHSLHQQHPDLLPAAEGRQLTSVHHQAALLADLLTESLEEILGRLGGLQEQEWQAVFARRYTGRAVILDTNVRRDPAGSYHLDYRLFTGTQPAKLEVADLSVFHALPLEEAQRLIFGARLAGLQRLPPGRWVVRFQPESGVLLTDAGAVSVGCSQPLDEALFEVLGRQAAWMEGLP